MANLFSALAIGPTRSPKRGNWAVRVRQNIVSSCIGGWQATYFRFPTAVVDSMGKAATTNPARFKGHNPSSRAQGAGANSPSRVTSA